MNNKKAKYLRKRIYGDLAQRTCTYKQDVNGTVRCTGLRAVYQKAKRKLK